MKKLFAILVLIVAFASCSNDDTPQPAELTFLEKIGQTSQVWQDSGVYFVTTATSESPFIYYIKNGSCYLATDLVQSGIVTVEHDTPDLLELKQTFGVDYVIYRFYEQDGQLVIESEFFSNNTSSGIFYIYLDPAQFPNDFTIC